MMARRNSKSVPATRVEPFQVRDCALICRTANVHPVLNLRELRDRLEICPDASLYHHFCETRLRATFDDPEYPNDFAVWAAHALRDPTLAERLGMLNPYEYNDLSLLRRAAMDIIEDHLAESSIIPWAPAESQFQFLQAMTIVFDTGVTISSPEGLSDAVARMTPGSIYFHFIEARRRLPSHRDDFSAWLLTQGKDGSRLADQFAGIAFYYLSLREIQERVLDILGSHPEERGA